jgi:hypothetical protein
MGWTIRGSNPGTGKRFIASYQTTGQFWGLHSILSSGYQGILPCVKSSWSIELITNIHLVPKLRMSWAIPPVSLYALTVYIGITSLISYLVQSNTQLLTPCTLEESPERRAQSEPELLDLMSNHATSCRTMASNISPRSSIVSFSPATPNVKIWKTQHSY